MNNVEIDYILRDIKAITRNVVVKLTNVANSFETVDSKREGDKYVIAKTGRDSFASYRSFPKDILVKAGITDPEVIKACEDNKYNIPYKKRDLVVKFMRQSVIDEYDELNDYYREIIGKPPLNEPEENYVYLTEEQMKYYHIDEVRPIHDYPMEIQIKLERFVIPELIQLHPEKSYLRFLGSKSVDLVRARQAKPFEIIFTDIVLDNVFLRKFFETYEFCREYFMSVIYNRNFRHRYEFYDNFIGMNIMFMTIQRVIVDTIKLSIDRDFYDLRTMKKMFDCYGMPFFEDLPIDYQRNIIKNMNMLIRAKATDRVLYDVTNVLMYERVQIYKYLLVKERLLDKESGEPIIEYKTVTDEDGNETTVPDYEKMYDVYFQSTDILEPNIILAIENKPNRYNYDEVTEEDVYWHETEELKKELYEREYNFIETKYLGINLMYNLTDLLYETVYFLNLLVDNKDTTTPMETRILNRDAMKTGTDYLFLNLNRITAIPVSIFDSVIILCALVSKKNGMKGNIICERAGQILSVLGFNFEADFDLIKESIAKYPRIFKNPEIARYLDLLDIEKVEDIETLYHNFKNFAEFCAEQVENTVDINEYKAYKHLYKVFTVRKDLQDTFRLSDGTVAKTYLQYLYDKLPHIAEFIDGLHKDKLGVYIEHVIGRLNELVPDIEYLNALNGTNNNITMALISLINFFKSYTTDLRNLNVVYYFNDKFTNKIYMIDDPRLFIKLRHDEKALKYNDVFHIHDLFNRYDELVFKYKHVVSNALLYKVAVEYDERHYMWSNMSYEDYFDMKYKDLIENVSVNIDKLNSKNVINDKLSKTTSIMGSNTLNNSDGLQYSYLLQPTEDVNVMDNVTTQMKNQFKENNIIRDTINIFYEE